jgi:hypothetical protein
VSEGHPGEQKSEKEDEEAKQLFNSTFMGNFIFMIHTVVLLQCFGGCSHPAQLVSV